MSYILNIYEIEKYIYSNISYKGKLYLNFNKNKNFLHYNIFKKIKKKKIDLNIIKAISVNLGPAISYTRIRNILSTAKGLCLSLNIPLIKITIFKLFIYYIKIKKKIKKYKFIYFIIINNLIYKYNIYTNKIYIINNIININKYIYKNLYNNLFIIEKKFKNKIYITNNNINFYKIPYKYINLLSYKLFLKNKFINNINNIIPIYK
ncbi:MAG: hypothetical protein NHG00_00465 [Candidatus Shikimatogenerans sp. JK-2022]|nr:hypothetical protein [Candidatus Shikimatogenerans bostrichidophilus]